MEIQYKRIPNLQIVNIGSKRKPLLVIKGFIELPCWNGYYLYDDTYKLKKDKVVTGGRIDLWVDGEITHDRKMFFAEEQVNTYFHLLKHQESIKGSILQSLFQDFPRLLAEEYTYFDQEDVSFPKLIYSTHEFDFKDYIGPESISIGEDFKDDAAYVKWRFRCRWDEEHGLEIVTHKERIIDISPEVDPWKIYKDNGTYEQVVNEFNESATPAPFSWKKKWWQIWK